MSKLPWQKSGLAYLRARAGAAQHPERWHGWGKRRNYFEGWYCKLVVPDLDLAYAFIPGLSLEPDGSGHAFLQVLDGARSRVAYHKYELADFVPADDTFDLKIGPHRFWDEGAEIHLPNLNAFVLFKTCKRWPRSPLAPGVMGWYGFVPGMECYHGLVSAHHQLSGWLEDDRGRHDLQDGIGYMEKDWGSSFPAAWVWLQSNHLTDFPGRASLMASVARIPWRGAHFRGFLCTWLWEDELQIFTTWNNSKHEVHFGDGFVDLHFRRSERSSKVSILAQALADRDAGSERSAKTELKIRAYPASGGNLVSPTPSGMAGKINESLKATLDITYLINGQVAYTGQAEWAGLEVSERAQEILT
ncbi:MAG: tocopherol cyclase family protein [Bacteroidota bacterium]